jgi:hypothetical protein
MLSFTSCLDQFYQNLTNTFSTLKQQSLTQNNYTQVLTVRLSTYFSLISLITCTCSEINFVIIQNIVGIYVHIVFSYFTNVVLGRYFSTHASVPCFRIMNIIINKM